jgi:hypothetical protein
MFVQVNYTKIKQDLHIPKDKKYYNCLAVKTVIVLQENKGYLGMFLRVHTLYDIYTKYIS